MKKATCPEADGYTGRCLRCRMQKPGTLFTVLLLAALLVSTLAGCGRPAGEVRDPVVASYRGQQILESAVEREQERQTALAGGKTVSRRAAIDQLLLDLIMLDEAERRGLSVTQEEVDLELTGQRQLYEQDEQIREMLEEYCSENGITVEQHFAILEEQMPRWILRQKLRDALGQEYCEAHGLEFQRGHQRQEVLDYVEDCLHELLSAYSAEITYYE